MKQSNLLIIYMLYGLFFVSTLTSYSAKSSPANDTVAKPGITNCLKPRPQICTMEYRPVCAKLTDGSQKTYASACSACANPNVSGHIPGKCPEEN